MQKTTVTATRCIIPNYNGQANHFWIRHFVDANDPGLAERQRKSGYTSSKHKSEAIPDSPRQPKFMSGNTVCLNYHENLQNIYMNKLIATSLIFVSMSVFSAASYGGEETIKFEMAKKFPYSKVLSVSKTPYFGLYEVAFDDRLVYTDEEMKFLFSGNMLDLRTLHNLTEDREKQLYAIDFDKLPFEYAIKNVTGNGARRLAVFSDPNCKYCKKLEKELTGLTNATIFIFMFPILPGSEEKVRSVWCSSDRQKSWENQMLRDIQPVSTKQCDTTGLGKIVSQANKLRISVTPTLIFEDGVIRPGILTLDLLEERLEDASRNN